jgi:formylglycine-generating enzyme required for sulfatase activity
MRAWGWSLVAAGLLMAGPLGAQQAFRDCPACPEMVVIPSGTFVMGAAPGEEEREGTPPDNRGRAEPQRRVSIDYRFALAKHEVTRGQFAAFVHATGHSVARGCVGLGPDGRPAELDTRDWRNPGFEQADDHPVVCVSWNDAQAYVDWLKKITGKAYRLPSEAEWEYAARAGSLGVRYWGDAREDACRYANGSDETRLAQTKQARDPAKVFLCKDGYAFTAPVGRFHANAFGLHDMLGNVWEWVADCWNATYRGAPVNGSVWGKGECALRVARGGAWVSEPRLARSAMRNRGTQVFRGDIIGFRVARGD